MQTITHSEIQELVKSIPDEMLPQAYRLLQELTAERTRPSSQEAFLQLPLEERARQLAEQAEQMKAHYVQSTEARADWQSGDFEDEH